MRAVYRIRNWREYDQALVRRGSLTVWVDQGALDAWHYQGPNQWGGQFVYSDAAIRCLLTLRAVSHLPLRATQGMAASIFELMGLDLDVPHYSTLSRRAAEVAVDLARRGKGPLHLVLDSTGLKVYGEGEWKVRKHGYSRRRTWRKLHLAIDAQTHEVQAVMVTEAGVDDAEMAEPLLKPIDREIAAAAGDGAYDKRKVYRVLEPRTGRILIPPRGNARIWKHGNTSGPPLARDENLRAIRRSGRNAWKRESGYHMRSLAETGVCRLKVIFGDHLASRRPERQATEGAIRGRALNIMTRLGMPQSVRVA
ncbi:Transposase DDE domain protein (plasmid) [Tautonia plasticadhaerens]|uniref:Transposase DDE domain protein n=2 Tax=Tautonia plasticadhaerens TaxID=2527974 RepID=A0A518HF32_9BACT|nr:IS5 family transposase [Tautonia plasticadhaerens]QDV39345.1 Transposase DDE domain protein [Tautonia plasticadhaerens]QDV39386.1 Transposase DDE domain protein [Tautonia plasticadhaerens]